MVYFYYNKYLKNMQQSKTEVIWNSDSTAEIIRQSGEKCQLAGCNLENNQNQENDNYKKSII